ncbi:hypothetical protein AB0D99_05890 [Streptomyces sp. NPDC047971]|uniref:hypothetical protein n=1 Tax=Streptomyces sp. NPDC047971 TaxID=3154499 RepID=UPI0033FC1573
MHADIHLQLHHVQAAELRRAAADSPPRTPACNPVRARIGWTMVALGLRLALPSQPRPGTRARRFPLAA